MNYILLNMEDVDDVVSCLPEGVLKDRLKGESGGDFEDISAQLKGIPICHACVVESQQSYCNSLTSNKLGRRLLRLINRANVSVESGNN